MKKLIYQKRYLILKVIGIVILLGGVGWYQLSPSNSSRSGFNKKEKTWKTVKIETARDFASIKLPSKVKSNKFAVISPRRTGIIQDLLVDIGDEVYKGQTIGSMLPEGVEGQSSAAINEASAKLQKARAGLAQAKGVAVDAVSVATTQLKESTLKSQTQGNLDQESQKQLEEKRLEAILVATQAWEGVKLILFGTGSNRGSRDIVGSFSNSIQENKVENLADEIQRMEESGKWNESEKAIEHLSHLERFLIQVEILYKDAYEGKGVSDLQISNNLTKIQGQQLRVTKIKQSILSLEEKAKKFSSVQIEREAGVEKSKGVLGLVQSQQNLTITQAEKNVAVALANYNAALVKAGHQSITSPFSGIITARMAEVGQAVMVNMPLFYLEGAQTTRSEESLSEIHFNLPESWKNKVKVGDKVSIKTIDGESFDGEIFRLSKQINLKTNSIMATAIAFEKIREKDSLTNPEPEKIAEKDLEKLENATQESEEITSSVNFQHGQSLFVYVKDSNSSIFTVPTLSIKKRSNEYFLWKMEGKEPLQVQVEVIAEDGEFSQVFSKKLGENNAIISNPSVSLFKKSS